MLLLKIPVFGKLIMLGVVIRFTRTPSTPLSSGVPLLKALDMIDEVRSVWQFYRDRRPETYDVLTKL